MSELPPGFVLEQPQAAAGLPPGFVLEPQGTAAARLVGQFAQGTNDAIANTVGAPVDLVAAGLRKFGAPVERPIGGSESIRSVIDAVASVPGKLGLTSPDAPVRFEPQTRGEKIANLTGQGVGSALSVIAPAGLVARGAAPGTLTQAIAEQLSSQPVAQTVSSAVGGAATGASDNPYVGLAAGLATPLAISAGRGMISPTTNRLSANERALVAAAGREGIPTTPAQATGSPVLRGLEETMARIPGSAGTMRNAFDDQREAFNRAVLSRTGTPAADAAPATLERAYTTLGQTFDDLARRTTVNGDAQFAHDIARVSADYGRRLPTDMAPVFQSYIDDIEPFVRAIRTGANPQIAGDVFSRIHSGIATTMRENQNNGALRRALGGLLDAFDDVMERSASPALRQEWQEARRQYAALKTVDKAMSGGRQADRAAADIPLGAFSGAVKAGDKTGYARARGQYGELAKIADMLAPQIPNSGTPERLMWANLLTGGALGGGAGLATGSPMTAIGTAAATTAGPWLAAKLYNTDAMRRYLTNQAAGRTNFGALYGGEATRQLIDATPGQDGTRALARALSDENEKRRRAAQ